MRYGVARNLGGEGPHVLFTLGNTYYRIERTLGNVSVQQLHELTMASTSDMGSKHSKKAKKSEEATCPAMGSEKRFSILDSFPLDEEPSAEELEELSQVAEVSKQRVIQQSHGSNKTNVKMVMDGATVVVHGGGPQAGAHGQLSSS